MDASLSGWPAARRRTSPHNRSMATKKRRHSLGGGRGVSILFEEGTFVRLLLLVLGDDDADFEARGETRGEGALAARGRCGGVGAP